MQVLRVFSGKTCGLGLRSPVTLLLFSSNQLSVVFGSAGAVGCCGST
ncbi:hypothetical protein ACPOL_1031 [Acidisarcina polymorpha]|uniref:Uncharacterized protein n=1 Tax=Acidisarcina polymorpha TaxID=2211140 RepID=A0A2Z5FUH3_9BACT|nr:hypothetical protein ACPOL_1031 [Acidisarcina polymorpha]